MLYGQARVFRGVGIAARGFGAPAGKEVMLQKFANRSCVNRIKQKRVMMFRRAKQNSLAGEWRNKHDPEEG
jgi:hypothetical protein